MNWTTQCAAVIPCLNEETSIGTLVSAVRKYFPATLVVDDGSSDGTALAAQDAGAEVIRHAKSLGKGTALQTGWTAARERGFEWALALDGDGQHAPDDIPAFLSCAERSTAELVVGNRMDDPGSMPWVRYRVNRWMSRQISKLAGQNLPDSQCGFRLMNLNAWSILPVSAAHFEIESAVLLAFARAGRRIEFVPIQVIYKSELSKIHPVRDTLRWFRWHRAAKLEQSVIDCLTRPETVPCPQK